MVKFKLNEKEYIVPEFISLGNYTKIFKVKDLFSEQYFAAKLINLVMDVPLDDLLKCDYEQINYIATTILGLIPVEKEFKFIDRFEIDGVHYGFFPNWKDLSFAEFVDMDTLATKKPDELLDYLHILAAVMFRPIEDEISEHNFNIEEYDVKTMIPRAELFKNKLDIKILLGAQFFFIKFAKKFSVYTLLSLTPKLSLWKKIKIMYKMRKIIFRQIFRRPTDGLSSSTDFLITTLQNTITSTKKL